VGVARCRFFSPGSAFPVLAANICAQQEMNLASQTVLEGLNACLDHRGEVYIAELDQVFKRHPDFKLFAAQNPHHQGGGRKGLPSSFVNRFIVVYSDVFTKQDLLHVTAKKFGKLGAQMQHQIIEFMSKLDEAVVSRRAFGLQGSPWEFNLRDTLRWGDLLTSQSGLLADRKPDDFLDIVIRQRFRSERDRQEVGRLFSDVFGRIPETHGLHHDINPSFCQVGIASLERNPRYQPTPFPQIDPTPRLKEIESIMIAVKQDLPCILVGPSGSGKSSLLNHVAAMAGKPLVVFSLNADVDTMDLIGGFEQADPHREVYACLSRLREALQRQLLSFLPMEVPQSVLDLMAALDSPSAEGRYEHVLAMVEGLRSHVVGGELAELLDEATVLLRKPLTMDNPRFEWLDGVIVRAVQTGAWLVLDNANLCSASVLDRLNSLLERPNGTLSINEHSEPGGEPRMVEMHPDFRIFLTVDPRYGELSRAMRNRSIEIYLDDSVSATEHIDRIAPIDGTLQRYHAATSLLQQERKQQLVPVAFDVLSLGDTRYLEAFSHVCASESEDNESIFLPGAASQRLSQILSYISSEDAAPLRQSVIGLYGPEDTRMLMPLHPLLNSPVIPALERNNGDLAYWLAACYEFYLDIQDFQVAMDIQLSKVNISKPAAMNRFQRSSVAHKVASLSRDSTANAARFLVSLAHAVKTYLVGDVKEAARWKDRRSALRRLMAFWQRTFESLVALPFEEARFQAQLIQGASFIQDGLSALTGTNIHGTLSTIAGYLERDFVVGFKLSTGLSMEALWNQLRPDPIPDQQTLAHVVELERLAGTFDSLRWRADVNVSTLRNIQDTMAKAYVVIRTGKCDATSLVRDLQAEISSLEAGLERHTSEHKPFFTSSFEGLRQALVLHQASKQMAVTRGSSDVDVLANIPTVGLMRLQSLKPTAFQMVDYMLVQKGDVHPWSGTLSRSLLLQYGAASSASLLELHSLEVELPIMGRALARTTEALTTSTLEKTETLLLRLMSEVLRAHGDSYSDRASFLYQQLLSDVDFSTINLANHSLWLDRAGDEADISGPQHVVDIFKTHFYKTLTALAAAAKGLQPRSAYTSIAWVQFSLGCIKLFVPDKIFDPHHRAQVEAEEHQQLHESLQNQIAAFEAFELAFAGQRDSIRSQLLTEEVTGLGEPPVVQSIYRPSDADLRGLQGEFNNVLNTIVKNDVSSSHLRSVSTAAASLESGEAAEELALIEQNVVLLIGRLMGRFEAYQDLTLPLISFLRCLQTGLSIGRSAIPARAIEGDDNSQPLMAITPFLGGTVLNIEGQKLPLRSLEFLSFVQAVVAVEGLENIPTFLRRALHESLVAFHEEWSKKLEADRKLEEQRTSLFRHKGSLEDEEEFDQEEFEQLFPDYYAAEGEDGEEKPRHKKPARGGRELSVLLADIHEKIFLSPTGEQQSVRALCTNVALKVARETRQSLSCDPELDRILLPATIMAFDELTRAFGSNVESTNYNFYTDINLIEVRKLLDLVAAIRKRFLELQGIDEIGHHQTLADVVLACDKVSEMPIDDPLASFLPSVERLYTCMYEWHEGGWATKANKALALYEKLRDTICDWRRLELSSWSRLLDTELKKCHDDAKSWWFIAYGAVILEPCSILQRGLDLKEHAAKLLGVLQSYFAAASVGQFSSRLDLLRQLKSQLDVLIIDAPELVLIRDAIENFIIYCSRYEPKMAETIRAGRAPLDRTMKDVLLMMKWRDKNIESLRDSARKSHQKLFKLVRKFRTVLEQPVKEILDQGLPEENHSNEAEPNRAGGSAIRADRGAIALCQQLAPWILDHPHWARMSNLDGVLKAIAKHGSVPGSAVAAASMLDDFMTDLVASMADLRKETPGTLTEENKELVGHLKTRKTNLYSDTLKSLRAMGFSRSLGTNILDRQSSTQLVLAGSGLVPQLSGSLLTAIEYFYHKTLDLAPRFRYATQEYSEDLSREVVHRSIGYLEGVLYTMFRQRQFLSRMANSVKKLEEAISTVSQLSSNEFGPCLARKCSSTNDRQAVRWVIQILKFAMYLVEIHGKLGALDNERPSSVLGRCVESFTALGAAQDKLPRLPDEFSSSTHDKLRADVEKALNDLRGDLVMLLVERPDLAFVVQQIQLWTTTQTLGMVGETHSSVDVGDFAASALALSSKILVALQNFQKTAQSLPQTPEDAGWLLQYSDGLEKSIDALRMSKIREDIEGLLQLLKQLDIDLPAVRAPATALLRAVLPIFEQYTSACTQNIGKYGELHKSVCRMGYTLSSSFVQIAAQGFCSPKEKSDEKAGDSGQVESGTGLGDGEGAEDISKDIKPDEDLSDLAQDPENKTKGDIEDNEDAVDMGEDDLEGDLGSVAGEDDEKEDDKSVDEDGDEEQDEQAGDVDDLDPTAVDEKMWDGSGEDDAEKDQQGDDSNGKKDENDQTAAGESEEKKDEKREQPEKPQEDSGEKGEADEEMDGEPGQEDEAVLPQEELNRQDQNVEENETLALPDDLNIDIDDESLSGEDDDLDDLEMDDAEKGDEKEDMDPQNGDEEEPRAEDALGDEEKKDDEVEETEEEGNVAGNDEEMDVDEEEENAEEQGDEEAKKEQQQMRDEGNSADQDNAAPSDVRDGGGQAQDEDDNARDEQTDSKATQREQGAIGKEAADQDNAAPGEKGKAARADQEQGPSEEQEAADTSEAQPFKKLGDALERWYKNQKDIRTTGEDQQEADKSAADMARTEFQHLQDEKAEADAQALGTATDEEVRPMDDAMAIDNEMDSTGNQALLDDAEAEEKEEDVEMEDMDLSEPQDAPKKNREDGRSGVATRQGALYVEEDEDPRGDQQAQVDEEIQETSSQLLATHLTETDRPLRGFSEALEMWTTFQTKTQPLSLSLSSQLRLILTPSQSTKLSGSFRTGKRLNIKKIIPYIASSYKRDKIWMRRSIPSKRAYQILLCVDDSSSMGDNSSSGHLALESFVMVARALTMLEVGQVGVLGFGSDVFVAHDLTGPLFASHDAGARVLQHFTFKQDRTDMCRLLRSTIDQFRDARLLQHGSSSGAQDLWQLALILSDGLVQSKDHARLRPLLREAMEQRVMVVFIVMDDAAQNKKGHSVLELKEARFGPDGVPVIHRYLDSFPFPYYLIVHHLEDLPGALAALLRTWFAEVNA